MTRLSLALGLLILAAGLAVLAYVLARPKWSWEPAERRTVSDYPAWSTGSPWSVTSRADNGSGLFV
jgi:hypothetical protein